jgi:phosphatidylinositol alpha-1,6-mannosyltransferase
VDDADLPGLYRLATLYLGLSREEGREVEGFGISFVEASASGLPVVAGRSGGVPDAVRDGVTGVLVDPADVASITREVGALLSAPDRLAEMAAAGRHAVESFYTWERVARVLHGLARAHARPTPER